MATPLRAPQLIVSDSVIADLELDARFSFVHGDICDREAVTAAMQGHDMVVHFAAESHVDRFIEGPDTFVLTNRVLKLV